MADLCRPRYELIKQQVLASKVIHTDDKNTTIMETGIANLTEIETKARPQKTRS